MRINSISNTMPMAVRNNNKKNKVSLNNQTNSKNPNFGMNFHIRNSDAELIDQIDYALHTPVSKYSEQRYPYVVGYKHIKNQEGYAFLISNILNICLPFKTCLGNKDYSMYKCDGWAPKGEVSFSVGPQSSYWQIKEPVGEKGELFISCHHLLKSNELQEKRKELARIMIANSPNSKEDIEKALQNSKYTPTINIQPVYTGDIEDDTMIMSDNFYKALRQR